MRLALLLLLASAGCGGAAAPKPPPANACSTAPNSTGSDLIAQYKQTGNKDCLFRSAQTRKGLAKDAAIDLLKRYPADGDLALELVNGEPPETRSKVGLKVAQTKLASPDKSSTDKAVAILKANVANDPGATESARILARIDPAADTFCAGLAAQGRKAQAAACLDGAQNITDTTFLAILRTHAVITGDDIRQLNERHPTASGSALLKALNKCEEGKGVNIKWGPPTAVEDISLPSGVAQILSSLADNTETASTSECFAALSAAACVQEIHQKHSCSANDSLARYAKILFANNNPRAEDLLKGNQYVSVLFAQKQDAYARPSSPDGKAALVQLHTALAYIYHKKNMPDRYGHDWRWHQQTAQSFWNELHPNDPFPAALELK